MKITSIKTKKIIPGTDLYRVLDESVTSLNNNSVLAITSKIISLCENNVVKMEDADKEELIHNEADLYLPADTTYKINLTIKSNILIPSAGIDESNGNGYYIFWPKNPQQTANNLREYLTKKFSIKHLGIIIVDSKTTPLRWGVTGTAICHSGFAALRDYTGTEDIFGRKFKFEKSNISDSLAAAAVVVMGEGNEQTPVAVLEDLPFVEFQDRNPLPEELKVLRIGLDQDLYKNLLTAVEWKKGRSGK